MSVKALKALAQRLVNPLATKHGVELERTRFQDALAAQFRLKDWNTSMAQFEADAAYVFGVSSTGPCLVTHENMRRHTLITGQPNPGYFMLIRSLVQQQIVKGGGFIYLDSTHDEVLSASIQQELEKAGRANEFLAFNFHQPASSSGANLLETGDASEIVETILASQQPALQNLDSDTRKRCFGALSTLVLGLQAAERRVTFQALLDLVKEPLSLTGLQASLPKDNPAHQALQALSEELLQDGTDTLSVKDMLAYTLLPYANGDIGAVLNEKASSVSLQSVLKDKKYLYISLPTMCKDAYARGLGCMVLEQLKVAVAARGEGAGQRDPVPFLVLIEDPLYFGVERLNTLMVQARAQGIGLVLISTSLYVEAPGHIQEVLVENTWNKVFFKPSRWERAEFASRLIGNSPLSDKDARRVPADELLGLDIDEAWTLSGPVEEKINVPFLPYPSSPAGNKKQCS